VGYTANSMERRLVVVTDVFEVVGRCICALPVLPYALVDPQQGEPLKPGDQLELRRPSGEAIKVRLYGLGWPSPAKGGLIIQLEPSVSKGDIPLGTEIWKV
jgi:hypothetical protein